MPEYNIVQNPEATRRIQQWVGSRQAHVGSTVDENIGMVVIVDDLRESRREINVRRRLCCGGIIRGSDAVNNLRVALGNPAGSGVLVKIRDVAIGTNAIGPVPFSFNHNKPLSGFVSTASGQTIFLDLGITDAGFQNTTSAIIRSQVVVGAQLQMGFTGPSGTPTLVNLGDMTLFPDQYLNVSFSDGGTGGTVGTFWRWTEEPLTP